MAAGSIVLDLLLRSGSFSTDTQRAAKDLEKLKKQAYETGRALGDSLKNIAGAVGITLSAAAFAGLIRGSIDAADHLNDLSKKTGIAVDTLGGMGFAAGQAGGDLESVAAAAGKLNKTLAAAAAGNKEAGDVFKTLGVSVTDAAGATRKADEVMADLADRFAEWEDGPEKSALALKLFGKAGADIIPLLNDGGRALRENIEYYKRYSGVTADTAKQADEFNDTIGKINLLSGAFGRTLAAELLPMLQSTADEFLKAKESGDGFKSVASGIVDVLKGLVIAGAYVVDTFRGVGREIGAVAAQAKLLDDAAKKKRDTQGFFAGLIDPLGTGAVLDTMKSREYTAISDAVRADGEQAKKDLARLVETLLNPFKAGAAPFSDARFAAGRPPRKKPAPRIPDSGAASSAAAEAQKQYDGQIKAAQDFAKQQRATFDYANRLLDDTFDQGLTSLRDYYAQQQIIRDAGLQSSLQAIDAEIAVRRKESKDSRLNPAQRLDASNKLAEAEQKRSEITVDAARENVLAYTGEAKVFKQFADQMVDLQAQIAEASGDTRLADSLRIQRQIADAQRVVNALGADPAIVEKLRAQLQTKSDLARLDQDAQFVIRQLAVDEDKLSIIREKGGATELEQLIAIGAERRKAIPEMEAIVSAQEAIARASDSRALILNAEEARAALERLKAEADPLAKKFNEIFESSFGDAFADFVTGTKTAKEAFRDFAGDVVNQLARMAAQNVAQSIFGGSGTGGAAGGGGWGSAIGGLISSWLSAGRAISGPTAPNTMRRVGETGAEVYRDRSGRQYLIEGERGGWVDAKPGIGRGGAQINAPINITVPGNTDRRTAGQIGTEVARQLQAVAIRLG